MSIERNGKRITMFCDNCSEEADNDATEEWNDFWARQKREGWRAKKLKEEWIHTCPECLK